ncbi:MAG TPA: hypothetical protein VHA12_01675 [Candidatus Nanoarchaeia archaeon]|nr:hypothetical protein [Candidatus Nanoarchaeia archaeon]
MTEKTISVNVDSELYSLLEKRAKKELCDVDDLVIDILRRSMVSYKKSVSVEDKTDDSLVRVFSRKQRTVKAKKKEKPIEPFYVGLGKKN